MKIFLGNYNDYIGPYQLAQKLLFLSLIHI